MILNMFLTMSQLTFGTTWDRIKEFSRIWEGTQRHLIIIDGRKAKENDTAASFNIKMMEALRID